MTQILEVRSTVLSLLEQARREKYVMQYNYVYLLSYDKNRQIKSSLEAEVEIFIPASLANSPSLAVVRREGGYFELLLGGGANTIRDHSQSLAHFVYCLARVGDLRAR